MRKAFTEAFDSTALDAGVLLLPLRGFLPVRDARIASTVAAIERELLLEGYLFRSSRDLVPHDDTLEENEGAFAMCGFWLVQVLERQGRRSEAESLFERLVQTANDVGVMSEEFDVRERTAVGNVPQALSHSGLIDAAVALRSAAFV
jgi:GH15 family glucan-1,4-alpha-glucosidase